MARNHRFGGRQSRPAARRSSQPADAVAPRSIERKPPTQYGAPFIVLEDTEKETFEFVNGNWTPFAMTIAECRQTCQVRMLPQQVSGKTRYEIRLPVE
ncbi:MAG: hypothetical protein IT427_10260 [Pirellulales bacterium]|nr:hypothetical protein [Pirellulales bacterium]